MPSPDNGDTGSDTGDTLTNYEIKRSGRSRGTTNSRLAYDGDTTTDWATTGSSVIDEAYVWFDLGGSQPIGEIRWLVSDAVVGVTMTIDVSSDRRSWDPVTLVSELTPGQWQSLETDLTARYVRFTFVNPVGAPVIGNLAEVEIRP